MFGPLRNPAPFHEAFSSHAAEIVVAAKALVQLFENPSRAVELAKAVSDAEHRGDRITHQTIARLHKTWRTPFDRTEIHLLMSRLDDILDLIEAAAERVVIFEIKEIEETAKELSLVLLEAALAVERAISMLFQPKQSKPLLAICVEINRIENKADMLYRRGIAAVFAPGNDPLLALKWRDVYEYLEGATDRCEDVANVLEGVVLEYG